MENPLPQSAESTTPTQSPSPQGAGSGSTETKNQVFGYIAQFEAWLESAMVTKAPFQIPIGGKEFLATIAPYLIIIGVVVSVLSLPALLGFGVMMGGLGMMSGYVGWGYTSLISLVSVIGVMALEAWAIPGLFKRTAHSWRLVFYATLVSFVGSILSFDIVGAVIGGVIGWYLLFQVKVLYKN